MRSYEGKIKVVGVDLLCFPVDPVTLEALGCGCYDQWAWTEKEPVAVETISVGEWLLRCDKKRKQEWLEAAERRWQETRAIITTGS